MLNMSVSPELKAQVMALHEQLRYHNLCYYVLDTPEISDAQYDELFQQLKKIEHNHPELQTPDSPTQRVGGEAISAFQTITHTIPMLSLGNAFSASELKDFERKLKERLESIDIDE